MPRMISGCVYNFVAVRGAQSHRVSHDIVQTARLQRSSAKVVQQMMIAVLRARYAAEHAHATEAADRGSELGDFGTEPFDTEFGVFGIEPFDTEAMCTNNLDDEFDLGAAP